MLKMKMVKINMSKVQSRDMNDVLKGDQGYRKPLFQQRFFVIGVVK